jgi:hypothetical protein
VSCFAFRIDRWTDDGERIVEHVAGAEDFQIATATYHATRKRWPKAAMTLRVILCHRRALSRLSFGSTFSTSFGSTSKTELLTEASALSGPPPE